MSSSSRHWLLTSPSSSKHPHSRYHSFFGKKTESSTSRSCKIFKEIRHVVSHVSTLTFATLNFVYIFGWIIYFWFFVHLLIMTSPFFTKKKKSSPNNALIENELNSLNQWTLPHQPTNEMKNDYRWFGLKLARMEKWRFIQFGSNFWDWWPVSSDLPVLLPKRKLWKLSKV